MADIHLHFDASEIQRIVFNAIADSVTILIDAIQENDCSKDEIIGMLHGMQDQSKSELAIIEAYAILKKGSS